MLDLLSHGLDVLSEFLSNVMTIDQWTLFIVAGLSAWAGYLLKEALSSNLMALTFFPCFLFGGLISRYLFIENGIFLSANNEANLILATGVGMIVSLLVLAIFMRLYRFTTEIRTRANRARMDRRSEQEKKEQEITAA